MLLNCKKKLIRFTLSSGIMLMCVVLLLVGSFFWRKIQQQVVQLSSDLRNVSWLPQFHLYSCAVFLFAAWIQMKLLLVALNFVFVLDRLICISWHMEASWKSLVVCFVHHLMVVLSRHHQSRHLQLEDLPLVIHRHDAVGLFGSSVINRRIAQRMDDMLYTSTLQHFWHKWIVKGTVIDVCANRIACIVGIYLLSVWLCPCSQLTDTESTKPNSSSLPSMTKEYEVTLIQLFKPRCNTTVSTVQGTFFSNRVINIWNNLPQCCNCMSWMQYRSLCLNNRLGRLWKDMGIYSWEATLLVNRDSRKSRKLWFSSNAVNPVILPKFCVFVWI